MAQSHPGTSSQTCLGRDEISDSWNSRLEYPS
jgi:hypothetical protein